MPSNILTGWLRGLHDLLEKHYRADPRTAVRTKSLAILLEVFKSNRYMYEEDLVEKAISPFLRNLASEKAIHVRLEGIKVLSIDISFSLPKTVLNGKSSIRC